jgi:hypothetical protein
MEYGNRVVDGVVDCEGVRRGCLCGETRMEDERAGRRGD